MKRIFVLIFSFFLLNSIVNSQTASKEEIKNIALSFMGWNEENINLIMLHSKSQFFVVQSKQNGWILLNASKETHPIIGYSKQGTFPIEIDDNAYLAYIQQSKMLGTKRAEALWKYYSEKPQIVLKKRAAHGPLLTTEWSQGSPYNDQCPRIYGTHALTGCGATALSQILNFHKYPNVGFESNTYTHNVLGELSLDFSQQTYNWTNMTDEDIAKLNYHSGIAVNMEFGLDYSSSYVQDIMTALKLHFKYSAGISLIEREKYTDSDWLTIIENEIDNERPIVYRGYSKTDGGHIWVCDGYDDNGFVHMNWGWGALMNVNGFYNLSNLTANGVNFNTDELMIIGIEPTNDFKYLPDLSFTNTEIGDSILIFDGDVNSNIVHHEVMNKSDYAYVMAAIANIGNKVISSNIEFEILVDGEILYPLSNDFENFDLNYTMTNYFSIGYLSVGEHTVSMIIDPNNKIEELNEQNNMISVTYTVVEDNAKPNLIPSTYGTDWTDNIELFDLNGELVQGTIYSNTSYNIHSAFKNTGATITDPFSLKLFIDNELFSSYTYNYSVYSGGKGVFYEQNLTLNAGTHILKFVIDSNNDIDESNEKDNVYEKTITVVDKNASQTISRPSGTPIVCDASTKYTYTVPEVTDATAYIWSVTDGTYESATPTGNSISIKWKEGSEYSATIKVKPQFANSEGDYSESFTVTVIPANVEIFADKTVLCHEDTAVRLYTTADVAWSNGVDGKETYIENTGTYYAMSKDIRCSSVASNSITISKTNLPESIFIQYVDSYLYIDNELNYTENWFYNDNQISYNQGDILQEGEYSVVLSDNTCSVESSPYHFSLTTDILDKANLEISYSGKGKYIIHEGHENINRYSIVNILGQEIESGFYNPMQNSITIPQNELVCFLMVECMSGKLYTFKLNKK